MSRMPAIFAVVMLATTGVYAQDDAEVAALRAELQQLRMALNQTRSLLAQAQRDIDALAGADSDRQAIGQWRSERARYEAEQRALTRERLRLDQARQALTRTAAAESRKVEALQSQVADTSQPPDKLPSRSTDHAPGYGYTQQYGWPYAYDGIYISYPGYGFSTGIYRPYTWGYSPYSYYRPYFYRPQRFRSGIHFGYDDGNFRFHFNSGSYPRRHQQPDAHHHVTAPPATYQDKEHFVPRRSPQITRPHPAFQLRLRDN